VKVPFQRLAADADPGVRDAVARVLASGRFVLGPEVEAFERAFAEAVGVEHAVGVASGTDAISLALAGAGIGAGDLVLTAAFTTGYTALGIRRAGATPVFADVEPESLCLDAAAAVRAMEAGDIRAIVPVHIFGGAGAGWRRLLEAAARRGVPVIEDACQAHGARFRGRPLGSFGRAAAFSFYPTKNLGALGDAGLVATGDADLAARVRSLRSGGQGKRHDHVTPGWNSRLDEIQAAVLRHRLPGLPAGNRRRAALALRYREWLDGLPLRFVTPGPEVEGSSHLFVVRTPRRDALRRRLAAAGIDALVHYPAALTEQSAFSSGAALPCPEAERAAREVLSLPLHPGLAEREIERVAAAVRSFFAGGPPPEAVSE
jgi:dTDP-3-amino-3,4,6-trideoxy-alpha-D-glucose transaminase